MTKNRDATNDVNAWKANMSPDTLALNADVLGDPSYAKPSRTIDYGMLRNAGDLGAAAEQALEGLQHHPVNLAAQSIILAIPPSANAYWRYTDSGVYVSRDAQAYKLGVAWKAKAQGMTPASGPVALHLNVYRARKAGDLDNYAKVLIDALKGVAFADDSQVVELHMWRHDDKDNPRVEVEVRRIEVAP